MRSAQTSSINRDKWPRDFLVDRGPCSGSRLRLRLMTPYRGLS